MKNDNDKLTDNPCLRKANVVRPGCLAQELRVGNLIKFISTGETGYVGDIKIIGVKTPVVNNVSISDVEPIPLNERYLIDFGFEIVRFKKPMGQVTGMDVYYGWDFAIKKIDYKTIIILRFRDGRFKLEPYYSLEFNFVHRLQNLYFSLTGEELVLT